jgi:hypothetical protein
MNWEIIQFSRFPPSSYIIINVTGYVIFLDLVAAKSQKGDRSFNYWMLLTNPTVDKGARAISLSSWNVAPQCNGRCWPTSVGNRNWTNN